MGQSLGCLFYPTWDQKDRMDKCIGGTHGTILRMSILLYMSYKYSRIGVYWWDECPVYPMGIYGTNRTSYMG